MPTEIKTKTKLLPCPFCGSRAFMRRHEPCPQDIMTFWFTVQCVRSLPPKSKNSRLCPVMPCASGDSIAEAASRWNTRQ